MFEERMVNGVLKKVVYCEDCDGEILVSACLSDEYIMRDVWICDVCLSGGNKELFVVD